MVVYADSIRGRKVGDDPPCAILFGNRTQPRTMEGAEGRVPKRSRHASRQALATDVRINDVGVLVGRGQVWGADIPVWPLIANVEAVSEV